MKEDALFTGIEYTKLFMPPRVYGPYATVSLLLPMATSLQQGTRGGENPPTSLEDDQKPERKTEQKSDHSMDHLMQPVWMNPERGWYFNRHVSDWRRAFRYTLLWVGLMTIIILLYVTGVMTDAAILYYSTALCWIINCLLGQSSITGTCLVGTGLSLWKFLHEASRFISIEIKQDGFVPPR